MGCRPAATILKNGQVLIVGGINEDGHAFRTAEIYNPLKEKFHGTGSIGSGKR
jgi:hypothetical protein